MSNPVIVQKAARTMVDSIKLAAEDMVDTKVSYIIKSAILDDYDNMLVAPVIDRSSKTNPALYREAFEDALNAFVFFKNKDESGFAISVPDYDNFKFNGRLKILKTILEGTAGTYVELSADDYKLIFGKKAISMEPFDNTVSSKDIVYLVRYTSFIQSKEKELKRRFVRFPFSNTAPINIFNNANKLVDSNLDKWVSEIKERAAELFKERYR